jgi:hypothetical protein
VDVPEGGEEAVAIGRDIADGVSRAVSTIAAMTRAASGTICHIGFKSGVWEKPVPADRRARNMRSGFRSPDGRNNIYWETT